MKVGWLVLVVLSVALRAPAQSTPRDISSELNTKVVQSDVPGLVAAIVDTTGVTALGAAGVRRRGSPAFITPQDKMHLGSCGKAMTATVIAMLVEEGKLSWSTSMPEAFPELSNSMESGWRRVVLRHLLTHSGGAPKELEKDGLWRTLWFFDGPPQDSRMQLARTVLNWKPEAPPDRKYIYSNAGYAIAGAIAERVSETPWEELIRARLFEPLGMTSAGFGPPGTAERLDQPRGHKENGDSVEPGREADNPAAIAPAGTVHSSIEDWAKFVQLHLDAELGKPRLLSSDSFRTLHTSANSLSPEYALGWGLPKRDWAGGQALTHTGSNTMWFCAVWIAPRRGFAVLVCCNQGGKKAEKTVDETVWNACTAASGAVN